MTLNELIKILYKKNIIGYFVLVLKKNSKIKSKIIYLAEIRIFKKYNRFLKNIFLEIERYSKKTGYDVLEYRNLNSIYKKYFNSNNYFQQTIDHNSYMLRFSSNINLKIFIHLI